MARQARQESPTKIYHVMMRGINKDSIFQSENHKKLLIEILMQGTEEIEVEIISYCIMDNHVHIVIKSEIDNLSTFFKKVNIKFAMKYNKSCDRVGHVFQDRYKSEVILNDEHLMQVVRYVHMNPVKACIISDVDKYKWSSYKEYLSTSNSIIPQEIKTFILDLAGSKKEFEKFHSKDNAVLFLDIDEDREKIKKEVISNIIKNYCINNNLSSLSDIIDNKEELKKLIKELLRFRQFTHREIAELLDVNRNLVHKINKDS